jgi:arginyl-tRNA synthetase
MEKRVIEIIADALATLKEQDTLAVDDFPEIDLTIPNNSEHGDFACNIALKMAKQAKMKPRDLAEAIAEQMAGSRRIESTEIAGPGFINIRMTADYWYSRLLEIAQAGDNYGKSDAGAKRRIQVEFVSANPTGPLHFGHGRNAAFGDSLCRILEAIGYDVTREFYINDAGNQMQLLGRSLLFRYREVCGENPDPPADDNYYRGEYLIDLARELKAEVGNSWLDFDEETALDKLAFYGGDRLLEIIRDDLREFGVEFDVWYHEKWLHESGSIEGAIEHFRDEKLIYDKDGASWFASSNYGDEKDRVVVRSPDEAGLREKTYFASDIAYHYQKFQPQAIQTPAGELERGFAEVIDIWGADHHGYVPRVSAAMQALGVDSKRFGVLIIKLVNLLREGKPVKLSKRAGAYDTLRDIIDEVGVDATRFIFLTRKITSALDFDLTTIREQSKNNPVYYVQYAGARINSVLEKAAGGGVTAPEPDDVDISLLSLKEELGLIKLLCSFPDTLLTTAAAREPQQLYTWTDNLAKEFHYYYTMGNNYPEHRILPLELTRDGQESLQGPVLELTKARIFLVVRVRQVLKIALSLLGVQAPESM